MLSEDAIENLIQPIIDRQEYINSYVIRLIADRIRQIGELTSSDVYKLQRLYAMGSDVRLINKEIAKLTGLQIRDIKKIIRIAALDSYIDAKPYYDYRQMPFVSFTDNIELQEVVKAIANKTAETYVNLSNSRATGFILTDSKNPQKTALKSITETYKYVIDKAVQATATGTVDYQTTMRKTLKQLIDSGIRGLSWDSGYTQRLDTAVRRNILDGIRAVNQGVQDETGRQFGADGKEITVHAYPAPDHAPVQGHQFSNEEFDKLQNEEDAVDYEGRKYNIGHRCIGILNCRHFTYSVILGVMKTNFTQAQLDQILRDNEKGYTLPNGKHLTKYECTQKQRQMETNIRKTKDGQIAARHAGDEELAKEYQSRINKLTKEYRAFSKAAGLRTYPQKMTVAGYQRIKV